jgi:glycosyltransferase involved in cell wall biosynthesis
MRILTEANSLDPIGGIELCTLQDSVALARRGHALQVMYSKDGLFRSRYEHAGIGLKGPMSFDIDIRRPFGGFARSMKAARWARTKDPDVLWLNRIEHIYWAQAVSRWSRCPIVCHLHNLPHPHGASQFQRTVTHFLAVSDFLRDSWIEAGVRPDRISVLHNALPPAEYPRGGVKERSSARKELGLPGDVPIVLYYGRMQEEKGVGTLLEAWQEMRLPADEALLVLVGSPSPNDEPDLKQQLARLNSESFRWFAMQDNMLAFLHAADVVVFPSWLEEGFGRVVIEGLATGRPVVASRVGAVPEILAGAMDRFLVEPRNPGALAEKIMSLLMWRQREPDLENVCALWVNEHFPYEEHVTGLEEVLSRYSRRRR